MYIFNQRNAIFFKAVYYSRNLQHNEIYHLFAIRIVCFLDI